MSSLCNVWPINKSWWSSLDLCCAVGTPENHERADSGNISIVTLSLNRNCMSSPPKCMNWIWHTHLKMVCHTPLKNLRTSERKQTKYEKTQSIQAFKEATRRGMRFAISWCEFGQVRQDWIGLMWDVAQQTNRKMAHFKRPCSHPARRDRPSLGAIRAWQSDAQRHRSPKLCKLWCKMLLSENAQASSVPSIQPTS